MQIFLTVLIGAAVLTGAAALCVRWRRQLAAGPDRPAAGVRTPLWAVFGGLFLFFALESALCRQVSLTLFLPVRAGQAMPLRVLRLGLCLLLSLALGTDSRGRKLLQGLERICQKDRGRWLVSLLVTGLIFAWTLRVSVLCYLISDDPVMLQTIASIPEKGLTTASHTFSNQLFAIGMSWFYKIAPDGYWYTIYNVGMPLLVIWLLGWCVLTKCVRRGRPVLFGCLVFSVFSAGVLSYNFGAVTFTLTAGIAGLGAVVLALCRNDRQTLWGRIASDAAGAVLLMLCTLQREACGQVLFCFWGLAMGYQLLKALQLRGKGWLLRAAAIVLTAAVTVVFVNEVRKYSPVEFDHAYHLAEVYRSQIEDYLIDHLEEKDFQAAGIPQELASLLHYWYFMDPRITTDAFAVLESSYYTPVQPAAAEEDPAAPEAAPAPTPEPTPAPTQAQIKMARLNTDLTRFFAQMKTEPIMIQMSALALILLLGSLALLWRAGMRYLPEALISAGAAGGTFLMCMYLTERTYFPLRAFQIVLFPATATELLMVLSCPGPAPKAGRVRRAGSRGLTIFCAAGAAAACFAGTYFIPCAAEPLTRADLFGVQWEVEDYARENADITVINNAYDLIFDPIHTAADYPKNLVWWGGCGDTAKPMEERLFADAFFRDDVQFMTKNAPSTMFLLQYLTVEFGPVQANTITRMDGGICIYDIDQILPEEPDYTGWYEQNGLTYYFRHGKPVTGEQTIDGEKYTFAAPGASSQFFASFTDDTLVYSNYAYSLVTGDE